MSVTEVCAKVKSEDCTQNQTRVTKTRVWFDDCYTI